MIPIRFQGTCHYCHEGIDIRDHAVAQWVEGWVENRTGGGAHAIRMPIRHLRFAHKWCIDTAANRKGVGQLGLFG